jgi:hypothetical protein
VIEVPLGACQIITTKIVLLQIRLLKISDDWLTEAAFRALNDVIFQAVRKSGDLNGVT